MEFAHVPVMLNECLDGLKIKSDGIYVMARSEVRDTRLKSLRGWARVDDLLPLTVTATHSKPQAKDLLRTKTK